MAKKHYRRHKSGIKSMLKRGANLGASALIASPVLIPAFDGIKLGVLQQAGGLPNNTNAVHEAVYSAIGYNMATNSLDNQQLGKVLIRDAVLVGGGLALRWASKKV